MIFARCLKPNETNSHVALLCKHDAERIRTLLYYISTMLKNLYDALLYKHDTTSKLIEIHDALIPKSNCTDYHISECLCESKKNKKKIGRDLQLVLVDDTTVLADDTTI